MSRLEDIRTPELQNEYQKKQERAQKILFRVVMGILASLILLILCGRFVFHLVIVNGHSMEPTMGNFDIYSSQTSFTADDIQYGTIVYFWVPDQFLTSYVKRVVGLPGDEIVYYEDGLYRNGVKVADEFNPAFNEQLCGPVVLGENEYYVLGDNRNNSRDSRVFGPVTFDSIRGIIKKPVIEW